MSIKASEQIKQITGLSLTIGGLLKSIREGEKLSQQEMACKLGVSKQYISSLERGLSTISPKQAQKFARTLQHSEPVFIKLALQDELNKYNLKYIVDIHHLQSSPERQHPLPL